MFYGPAISRGGGNRSGRHGRFERLNDVSDSAMDAPVDRVLLFAELFEVDLFAAKVENRGW